MRQKGFTLIELMIIVAIVGIVVSMGARLFVGSFSDGARVGELVKMSHKGFVFKTWEGQLKVSEGSTDSQGLWPFTVPDEAVATQMNELLGKRVKVAYNEVGFMLPWKGDTRNLAKSVTVTTK